jgi:phage terminase large subunit-like protein
MCAFPQGKHDHYTDASSRAFNRLARQTPRRPAPPNRSVRTP